MAYDGSITFDTHVDTGGFSSGTGDINKEFESVRKGAESAAEGVSQLPDALDETSSSTSRLADIVKGGGVFKLIEKGMDAVVSSLDSAIDRYDTMNRFPMMLQQMGYGADEADAAVQRLSEGIQGLPTTLDSVVSNAQRLTILTGNLDSAVDTTLALNNAFLASGAGSDGAARGLEQYIQALSRGKFEAEEWKTMQETMGLALNRIAESFGYAGESAQNDLYAALQNGEITFSQFNSRLIQLNSGVGGFADLAKTSSTGIKTAWTNMGTAMVRGTTTIIEALDKGLSETKFESIQNVIETTGRGHRGSHEPGCARHRAGGVPCGCAGGIPGGADCRLRRKQGSAGFCNRAKDCHSGDHRSRCGWQGTDPHPGRKDPGGGPRGSRGKAWHRRH